MEKSGFGNDSLLGKGSSSLEGVKRIFEAALNGVREEFDDHRESINDNTYEIEANYELLSKLESKVDRLQAQFEKLQLSVSKLLESAPDSSVTEGIELEEKEKEVFLVLYTGSKAFTYREIAAAVKESEFLVRGYITNMIEKGVSIDKRYVNDTVLISLDKSFVDRQAKENIVKLSQRTLTGLTV